MRRFLTLLTAAVMVLASELSAERITQIEVEPANPVEGDDVTVVITVTCNTNMYEWDEQRFDADDHTLTADLVLIAPERANQVITDYQASYHWGELEAGEYRVNAYLGVEFCGEIVNRDTMFTSFTVRESGSVTGEFELPPIHFRILDICPNPFNASTNIHFNLPLMGEVTLVVCDLYGREVATIASGRYHAGIHTVTFNGQGLATGVYVIKLQAGKFIASRKLMLIK